jgi:cell division protein FtsX
MKISDLQNVLMLARKGLGVVAANLSAQDGANAYGSIGEVEAFVANLIEQQKQQEEAQKKLATQPNVQVVEINQEATT